MYSSLALKWGQKVVTIHHCRKIPEFIYLDVVIKINDETYNNVYT